MNKTTIYTALKEVFEPLSEVYVYIYIHSLCCIYKYMDLLAYEIESFRTHRTGATCFTVTFVIYRSHRGVSVQSRCSNRCQPTMQWEKRCVMIHKKGWPLQTHWDLADIISIPSTNFPCVFGGSRVDLYDTTKLLQTAELSPAFSWVWCAFFQVGGWSLRGLKLREKRQALRRVFPDPIRPHGKMKVFLFLQTMSFLSPTNEGWRFPSLWGKKIVMNFLS